MVKYEIVLPTPAHVAELAQTIRSADVEEVWAMTHQTPRQALQQAVTRQTRTGLADGEVLCIFGVHSPTVLGMTGVPWMLSSDALPKHARAFLRGSVEWIEMIRHQYSLLVNYVDARNLMAIRWLKWLGFELQEPVPYGAEQLPFHRFEMRTS